MDKIGVRFVAITGGRAAAIRISRIRRGARP